jgi:NitT/TauT family transport system permease protein
MRLAAYYSPLLLLALAWEIAPRAGIVPAGQLPPLTQVLAAWLDLVRGPEFWASAAASLYRAGAGLAAAILVGTVLGVAMAWWRPVRALFNPLVEALYPLPKSALIPVTALWLGFGDASKIVLIFLACMIPVTLAAYNGARGCEQALVWSARSLGAGRRTILWDVVVPSALPELLNGVRIAIALAFILLVSSELVVSREGLGYLVGSLGGAGIYDAMFAAVFTVAFLGFVADRLYARFMQRMLRWRA